VGGERGYASVEQMAVVAGSGHCGLDLLGSGVSLPRDVVDEEIERRPGRAAGQGKLTPQGWSTW